jgi:hypothetical protein
MYIFNIAVFSANSEMYTVCLKSNVTGAIKFFINNWTKNNHHPFQSSSLGKAQTAGEVVLTPGSSAGSLHVEVSLAGLSRPFEVEFEFWEKEEVTRTQIRWVWELRNHWNTLFGQNFFHGDGSVDGA